MATADLVSVPASRRMAPKGKTTSLAQRQLSWAFFFLLPWLVGLLAFQLLPILFTIFLSFTDYKANVEFAPGNFNLVGLDNFQHLLSDPTALPSMGTTLKFALIGIPLGFIIPMLFALLVNSRSLAASSVFRTFFFLPSVIPVVAGTIIFSGVLNAQTGWIDLALRSVGIGDPPRWLTDPVWSVPALNLLAIWSVGNAMIILLAGLQGVPTELYEAAIMDGAGPVQRFFNITLPLISPIIFYNVTLGMIGAFQYFVPALLIGHTNGDPQGSLLFFPLHFYREAFVFGNMGYGSVLALVIFVITMLATALLFTVGQRLVYYAGSES